MKNCREKTLRVGPFLLAIGALVVFSTTSAEAQKSRSETRYESQTSQPSQFESLTTRYRFEADGTGSKEVMAEIRILDPRGVLQQSDVVFEYHPLSEELRIPYLRVRKSDGVVVNIDTTGAVAGGSIPTLDLDERHIKIPGLSVGDQIEYEVVTVVRRPLGSHGEFCIQHSFQPRGVLNEQLEIEIPKSREVKIESLPSLKSWQTTNGITRIYHWKHEIASGGRFRTTPYLPANAPDVQVSSFLSWEDVGRWYANLEGKHQIATSEVKAKAEELTKGTNNDLEKVEVLYNFVAKQIKYLSLSSLGIGGYEPHSAEETIRNGYGDCKDKVTLLAALLEVEGLDTSSVLINPSRQIDLNVPSPWPFTHVIAKIHVGTEIIWLDPSPAVLPFRMLPFTERGKRALVVPLSGVPHFEKTPSESRLPSTWLEEVQGRITEDGTLECDVRISAQGDSEIPLREAFLRTAESARPFVIQSVVRGIVAKTDRIENIGITDPIATDEPFILEFKIQRQKFINFANGKATFDFPLGDFDLPSAEEKGLVDSGGDWHRIKAEPVQLGPPADGIYKYRLEFPHGFSLSLPGPSYLKGPAGTYRAISRWDGTSLTAERHLTLTQDHLPAELRKNYAEFREKVEQQVHRGLSAMIANP